jgi:hypothetical protein
MNGLLYWKRIAKNTVVEPQNIARGKDFKGEKKVDDPETNLS